MRVEVVAIGDEVLAGYTVNANAARISRLLLELGLRATSHRVLPDAEEPMRRGLENALKENDLVICTGGLGPTLDDRTRVVAADLVGCGLAYRVDVAERLQARLGPAVPALKDQATIPTAARPIHNKVGTAPGLIFEVDGAVLLLLPGVPLELESMLDEVGGYLSATFPRPATWAAHTLHFFQVREVDVDRELRALAIKHESVSFGIYPSVGVVSVRLEARSESKEGAEGLLEHPLRHLKEAFKAHLFESPSGTLEEAVHLACIDRKVTLSCAESCTGGHLAARLTAIPGASHYFQGSLVTYSNQMKEKLLGVSAKTLEQHGAVSEETVCEMVRGLIERAGTDLGVAISGIAGPDGGSDEKPVGTVWIAVARRVQPPRARCFHLPGTRSSVIARSASCALAEVLKLVREVAHGSGRG